MDNSSVEQFTALMTDQAREITDVLFFAVIINAISVLGSVGNVINIIVFSKQGFQDTVNISFLALAVSDLGSLVTLIWKGISVALSVAWSDIPFSTDDVSYMTAVVPHATFVPVSWLITSFITIERCLCVTLPLKVKHVVTASRTVAAMALIYVCVFLGMSPFYIGSSLTRVFDLQTNTSRIVRSFSESSVYYTDSIGHNFSVSTQFGSIIIDLLSTLVIVRQMQVKWKWRLESTSSGTSDRLSVREKKLVKMVLAILCVFVTCVSPSCASFLCELVYGWKFGLTGPNYNVFITVCSVIITFEAAHSSVNIFIYYNMSAKYQSTFKQIFCKAESK